MASAKRDRLLETAERLFYEQGFHATGIDRIVAEAGVVRMTLYNHFPSKDALVEAVLRARHDRFLASLDAAVAKAAPGEVTRALVDAHCAWLAEHGRNGCFMVKAMGEFAEHNAELHALAAATKAEKRARIADALARDGLSGDPDLARRIFLILEGSNAAAPVLGADTALADTHATIDTLLATTTHEKETT